MNVIKSLRQMDWTRRAKEALLALAVCFAPSFGAQAAVSVDQSPLIVQNPLPPNIVLMLDDSGSMGWDYMPDWNYLTDTSADGVRSSNVNGVYYNPTITYTPPPNADGTSYPNASFPDAWVDGFNTGRGTADVTRYNGGSYNYFTRFDIPTGTDYAASGGYTYSCPSGGSLRHTDYGYYATDGWYCRVYGAPNYAASVSGTPPSCPNGGTYNSSNGQCEFPVNSYYFFTYSTGPEGGPYVRHYVGSQSDCQALPTADQAVCDYSPATQQNVANWFAYSHTRILMAKSGLMASFATLDPAFRFGFGSINGRNTGGIPSPSYAFATSTNSSNKLAEVEPFGDGASGTQKAQFWTWLIGENPSNSTPLRGALNAVGSYYQTAQPWQTSDTDTTAYTCRQSYAILTTDGFWNGSNPNVGNVDNTNGTTITGSTSTNGQLTYTYSAQPPYSDANSDTLADVAMKYWKTDLQPALANNVLPTPNDPAFWQHMTTFTVGLGFRPTGIQPTGITIPQIFSWGQTGKPPTGVTASSFSWPTPSSNNINNIADLAHAGVNGHGTFASADSPTKFKKAIDDALAAAGNIPGGGNSLTLSSTQTPTSSSADPLIQYRATYYTGQWTGTLTADKYNTANSSFVQLWDAGNQLPAPADRNIWTSKLSSGTNVPIEFKLATSLSTAEQAGLQYTKDDGTQVAPQTILDYLRGDNTYEQSGNNGFLRTRKAPLGDIVSSTPVLIGAPNPALYENGTFPGSTSYASFVTANKSRLPLLYVAGNDGMLHVFRTTQGLQSDGVTADPNASPGREVYAYIPAAVLRQTGDGKLSNLANPQYGVVNGVTKTQAVPHQYYNDGRITVQSVYFSSDSSWHTILVGTTGRGPAKAIYAMDITDPSVLLDPTKASAALLWERSADDGISAGDAYIGEMTGSPVIAQIQVGGTNSWAVFIGNGYNSAANKAALLQFDLKTGALTVHTTDSTSDNGLAEPGLMQPDSHNGISTMAFAGDLYGNIWKFDLSSTTSAGTKIFQAKDSNGTPQPVTSLVALTFDEKTMSTWALFGTGRYLANADLKTTQIQTWYGLRVDVDGSSTGTTNAPVVQASDDRTKLMQRTIVKEVAGPNDTINRATSTQTSATDMEKKAGWYMDLNTKTGERIINRTQFIGGLAVVTTLIPQVSDPCNPFPSGAVMLVDPYTGANSSSVLGDFNGDGVIDSGDGATVGGKLVPFNGKIFPIGPAAGVTGSYNADGKTISLSFNQFDGNKASLGPINVPADVPGRISWRELIN